jgi:hypothetical protein
MTSQVVVFNVVVPSTEIAIVVVVVHSFLSFASLAEAVWVWELLERGGLSAAVM